MAIDGGGGIYQPYPVKGAMNAQITDSPGAGTHKYRLVARVTTNAPNAGPSVRFTGRVDMVAQ